MSFRKYAVVPIEIYNMEKHKSCDNKNVASEPDQDSKGHVEPDKPVEPELVNEYKHQIAEESSPQPKKLKIGKSCEPEPEPEVDFLPPTSFDVQVAPPQKKKNLFMWIQR